MRGDELSGPKPRRTLERLGRLRAELRRMVALTGGMRVASAIALWALFTFALDRVLDLPLLFRAALLGACAVGAAVLSWRWWLQPARRAAKLSDDEAALLVERRYRLGDALISAVQLSRAASRGHAPWSLELVERVVEQAESKAESLDFTAAVERRPFRRAAMALGTVLLLLLLGVSLRPAEAKIWFDRLVLLRETPWPRDIELRVRTDPSTRVLARGDALRVFAEPVRGKPRSVEIESRFLESEIVDRAPMVEVRGRWRAVLENLNESLEVRVRGGDFVSAWYRVDVRPRPQIEALRIWVRFPRYTGLEDTPEEAPLEDGNLKVPAGSVVRFEALSTEPLAEAKLRFGKPEAVQIVEPLRQIPSGGDGGIRRVSGGFRVLDTTPWAIELVSLDGFTSDQAAGWTLRAVEDRLPEVRIVQPGRNKEATPVAEVPIVAELRDDYGLEGAALVYAVLRAGGGHAGRADEGNDASGVQKRFVLELPEPGAGSQPLREAQVKTTLRLEGLDLEPHDRLAYWIEAVDTRAEGAGVEGLEPGERGRSQRYTLQIVSSADLERLLQGRLKRLRDELEQVLRVERGASEDVREIAARLGASETIGKAARRRLTYLEMDQRRVVRRIERSADEAASVTEEMRLNRIGNENDIEWLSGIEAALRELAAGAATEALEALQAERKRKRPASAGLQRVAELGDVVVAKLEALVRRLDKWDEFNEVLREMRDLLEQADRVLNGTRKRAKIELGR